MGGVSGPALGVVLVPRVRAHRSVSVVVGLLLLLSGLSACDSTNPSPAPLPSASASATASGTPSPSSSPKPTTTAAPTAPTLPPEARGTSAKSAKAFVRYYVKLVNHAIATGDTGALKSISNSKCESCSAVVSRVEKVYSAGGRIKSTGWTLRSISLVPGQPAKMPIVDVGLVLPPQSVVRRHGARSKKFDGGRLPATFHLTRRGDEWIVNRWERAA